MLSAALVAMMSLGIALTGWAAPPRMKMTTTPAPGIAMPDKVESRLGTLRFFDGFPDKATVDKLLTIWTSSEPFRPTCWPSPQ